MTTTERSYHANGSVAGEVILVDGLPHGVTRQWHPNGVLAQGIPMTHGLVDGTVKQWNDKGELLGSFEIKAGTGLYRTWYPSGRLQGEVSYVDGKFTGRQRTFLENGALAGEVYWLENKKVSRKRYREASRLNANLPTYEDDTQSPEQQREVTKRQAVQPNKNITVTGAEVDRLASQLLAGPQAREALAWLTEKLQPSRSLGEATDQEGSLQLVKKLYDLGAACVHAVDITGQADEGQNAGRLVAELPQDAEQRKRLLRFCGRLAKRAGFDPDPDVGQRYTVLLLD